MNLIVNLIKKHRVENCIQAKHEGSLGRMRVSQIVTLCISRKSFIYQHGIETENIKNLLCMSTQNHRQTQ